MFHLWTVILACVAPARAEISSEIDVNQAMHFDFSGVNQFNSQDPHEVIPIKFEWSHTPQVTPQWNDLHVRLVAGGGAEPKRQLSTFELPLQPLNQHYAINILASRFLGYRNVRLIIYDNQGKVRAVSPVIPFPERRAQPPSTKGKSPVFAALRASPHTSSDDEPVTKRARTSSSNQAHKDISSYPSWEVLQGDLGSLFEEDLQQVMTWDISLSHVGFLHVHFNPSTAFVASSILPQCKTDIDVVLYDGDFDHHREVMRSGVAGVTKSMEFVPNVTASIRSGKFFVSLESQKCDQVYALSPVHPMHHET
jgi:hypothetical protein